MVPEGDNIKIKSICKGEARITYTNRDVIYEKLVDELRMLWSFDADDPITMKWLDEEGDPCTISSQIELTECFRLYYLNSDREILMHIFASQPPRPGLPCPGEDKSIYRRGARRWRKLYHVNGHLYQAKRFSTKAACAYCSGSIWGLGSQGFKCVNCKIMVHKRCHKIYRMACRLRPGASPGHVGSSPLLEHHHGIDNFGASYNDRHAGGTSSGSSPLSDDHNRQRPAGAGKHVIPSKHKPVSQVTAAASENDNSQRLIDGETRLSEFELLRVIGRGSYAKVMMVEHRKLKLIYAMKVIKKELVADEEDIEWVQTEKHVFEIATNHPFLVGLHSCFQTASRLFFIIEFVSGGDLMFHMQRQRRLPEDHAKFYAAEICVGLHFLHERGIIYRDLKLDNVLLDSEGHIKLTDYGMCKEGLRPGDKTSTFCGTPNYIAPEILRGEEYDYSVDWWALGVLMYEMLAGRSPFDLGNVDNPEANSEELLFQVILENVIRIPRSLSIKAGQVLKGFLNKNQFERLGCTQEGFAEIQTHQFFKSIDWDLLDKRQIMPPYKPNIKSNRDLDFFDPQFTNEPVLLTPDDEKKIAAIDQSEFEGFEYVNPFLMTHSDSV